jgi:hypothetical protein
MNALRRLAIAFVVALSTIGAVTGAAFLFLILGPVGLLLGVGLVAATPPLGLRLANGLEVAGEPLSRTAVIGCVWAALLIGVVGFPLVGMPLVQGDAFGGAVTVGLPLLVAAGTVVGVFWPSRMAS